MWPLGICEFPRVAGYSGVSVKRVRHTLSVDDRRIRLSADECGRLALRTYLSIIRLLFKVIMANILFTLLFIWNLCLDSR